MAEGEGFEPSQVLQHPWQILSLLSLARLDYPSAFLKKNRVALQYDPEIVGEFQKELFIRDLLLVYLPTNSSQDSNLFAMVITNCKINFCQVKHKGVDQANFPCQKSSTFQMSFPFFSFFYQCQYKHKLIIYIT